MTDTELREKLDYILDWHSRCREEIKSKMPGYADPKYAEEQYDGIVRRYRNEAIQLITQYGDTRERLGRKAAHERNAELLNALGLMYGQYCSKKLGHDFMGAGEAAIELLEEYGIHDEYSAWSDKTYDKLEQVVAELREKTNDQL